MGSVAFILYIRLSMAIFPFLLNQANKQCTTNKLQGKDIYRKEKSEYNKVKVVDCDGLIWKHTEWR